MSMMQLFDGKKKDGNGGGGGFQKFSKCCGKTGMCAASSNRAVGGPANGAGAGPGSGGGAVLGGK